MSSWTPNSFVRIGRSEGYDADYLDALVIEGTRLRGLGLPVVFTLGHIAALCGVPHDFLYEIVRRRQDPYRKFAIRKRSGGYRLITAPDPRLLRVQRWIHQQILSGRSFHASSTAYASGCDPLNNAQRHLGARWLVKVDVSNFFESISERQVFHVFRRIGYRPLLAFQLTRLCTRQAPRSRKYQQWRWRNERTERYDFLATSRIGHLPQGAPTSPLLANLVCAPLDQELQTCADSFRCTYTRYADDIVFSSYNLNRADATAIIRRISLVLGQHGLTRNRQKTHVVPPGARRIVTGLLVDGSAPKLLREFRENIELHLFHAGTKGIREHCLRRKFRSLVGFRAHLHGLITYAERVDPTFGSRCRQKFNALDWGELADLS